MTYRRTRLVLGSLIALLISAACSTQTPPSASQAAAEAAPSEVVKSPNDKREYRYLTLSNQLRVLLASDPEIDKAAASLVALRGQNDDPEEFGGLAHFLEHMLFIGTEKYPEVDEYQQFISAHGGSTNAYTAADHTNYFFDIHPDHFREGLDRFAHFFISPLLDPNYVEREKNAVHSEYQMQLKDDGWRGFSALKATMNPDHPASRFHIGSLETLGAGVQEALHEFLDNNYSADQMILVAITNEPLDTMEAWISPMFAAIENKNLGPGPTMPAAYKPEELPLVVTIQSLKNTRRLVYNFPVPPTEPHYRQKPALYITNLLGHEGHGSLHQHLKAQGWIESLAAGSDRLDAQNAFISIDIGLTEAGAQQIQGISNAVFAYVRMLQEAPVERWRYEEQARMAELAFRFQEQSSATGFAYRVGPLLDQYPPQWVLAAPYLMEDFDAALIRRYLSYLRDDNLVLEVIGPDVETDRVEPWFQVPYRVAAYDPAAPGEQPASFALPEPNTFIPDSLELLANDTAGPSLVIDKPNTSIWLDRDTEFGVPRANVLLTLALEGGLATKEDYVLARVYQRLLTDARNELTYPALLAGLSFGLSVGDAGFELQLGGYTDKQLELLGAVLDGFTSLPLDPAKFALYQAELVREWQNFTRERPFTQTLAALGHLLIDGRWPPPELAATLAGKTVQDLERWRKAHLTQFRVQGLAHGNLTSAAIEQLSELLADKLPLGEFAIHKPSVVDVTASRSLELPVDHQDAAFALYLQDLDSSLTARAQSALAVQLIRQSYFSDLRTEQQLGYVVALSNRTLYDRAGLTFIVQSPVAGPAKLKSVTKAFLDKQINVVEQMDAAQFEQHKAGLIARLTEQDKNLGQRSQRYWSDLEQGVLTFDSAKQISAHVAALEKPQMVAFLQDAARRLESQSILVFSRGKFDDVPDHGERIAGLAVTQN